MRIQIDVPSLNVFTAGVEYLGIAGVEEVNRKTVNILAQDFAEEVRDTLAETFDRPTPFTLRGISYDFARPGEDPVSRTFVRDRQSEYLLLQETGGSRFRTSSRGAGRDMPLGPRDPSFTDRYGGFGPKGVYNRVRKQSYKGGGKGRTRERSGKRPPAKSIFVMRKNGKSIGVFERLNTGAQGRDKRGRFLNRQRDNKLRLLLSFPDQADYEPRFHFAERAKAMADRKFVPLQQRLFMNEVRKRIGSGIRRR